MLNHRRLLAFVTMLTLVALAGARPAAGAGGTPSGHGSLAIRDVWSRSTPAGAHMGAVYFTINSPDSDRIIAAMVPASVAGETQIHETVMEADSSGGGGRMTMRHLEGVDLPPGQDVAFKPGGYHVMLMDLKHPLVAGKRFTLTLTLAKAGKKSVTATVRDE